MIMDLAGETARRAENPPFATAGTQDTVRADRELVRRLAASALFRDYQESFTAATGLPLSLRAVADWQLLPAGERRQNAFCAMVKNNHHSCAACLQLQQQACDSAAETLATLKCSFGLSESAVTVKLGGRTIGHLQTGQVFFKPASPRQVATAVKQLREFDATIDAQEATAAYQTTRVMNRSQYDSAVRLLHFFAQQLSLAANQIALQEKASEPPQVTRARQFIHEHWDEELSLEVVARFAAISPFYLCKKFKESTGLHFTDYISRVRIEKARELLQNPSHRISEVAYQTGFQSLSHFNRCFKRIAGESPTACREKFFND